MANISSFLVRKSGTNYEASHNGSYVTLRPNGESSAYITFDNGNNWVSGIFADEDEVEIYVNSVSAANKLMVGYVDQLGGKRTPNNKEEILRIIDWGSYLAGKTIFEKDYLKTKTVSQVFTDSAAEISGLSTGIIGLATSPDHDVKRAFNGTYVKDVWETVAEMGGADYFVDETKTLRAFGFETQNLLESGTGLIYKIKDIKSVSADTLMVEHRFPYNFFGDSGRRYRSVTVTNGIGETFPIDIDLFQTSKYKDDTIGKTFASFYRHFGSQADYNVDTVSPITRKPHNFKPSTDVGGGYTIPTVEVLIPATSTDAELFGRGIDETGTFQNMGIVATDWQRIALFMRNFLTGQTVNHIYMRLYDAPVGANYWERDILADLNTSNWTYIAYDLPANTVDAVSNGWTKNGSPTTIDAVYWRFERGAALLTGYTAGSGVEFGQLHFFRRRRATVTGAGTPATEKIIVDASMKSFTALTTLATKEQARSNVVGKMGECTILGNPAFKKPAYNIQVDFTNTLGTGRSGTVRIEELRHQLIDSHYTTKVNFNTSFNRP